MQFYNDKLKTTYQNQQHPVGRLLYGYLPAQSKQVVSRNSLIGFFSMTFVQNVSSQSIPVRQAGVSKVGLCITGFSLLVLATMVSAQSIEIVPRWLHNNITASSLESSAVYSLVDKDGNVYVAGNVDTGIGGRLPINSDIFVELYSQSGELLQSYRYAALGYGEDVVSGLEFTADGGLLVLGSSEDTDGTMDLLAIGLDAQLRQRWSTRYSPSATKTFFPREILPAGHAIAARGGFYMAGWSSGYKGGNVVILLAYSEAGELINEAEYVLGGYSPIDVAISPGGILAVLGDIEVGFSVQKFGFLRSARWHINFYNTVESLDSDSPFGVRPLSLIINKDASYYVLGTGTDSMAETDTLITRISSQGEFQWDAFGGSGRDAPIKIVSNSASEAITLIREGGRGFDGPRALVKVLSKEGELLINQFLLSDLEVNSIFPTDLSVNSLGGIVVGGQVSLSCDDISTLVCDRQGTFLSLMDSSGLERWHYLAESSKNASSLVTSVHANQNFVAVGGNNTDRGFAALLPVNPTFSDYKGFRGAGKDVDLPRQGKVRIPLKP